MPPLIIIGGGPILDALAAIKRQMEELMTKADDIKAGQARLVKAVENLGADVRELIGKIPAEGGLTAAEAEEIRAEGERIAAAAEAAAGVYVSEGENQAPPKA